MEAKIVGVLVVAMVIFTSGHRGNREGAADVQPVTGSIKSSYMPFPDSLEFAGESVPLELFDVREALDRELALLPDGDKMYLLG